MIKQETIPLGLGIPFLSHLFVFMGQLLRVRLQRRQVLVLRQVKHLDGTGIRRTDFLVLVLLFVCTIFTTLQGGRTGKGA